MADLLDLQGLLPLPGSLLLLDLQLGRREVLGDLAVLRLAHKPGLLRLHAPRFGTYGVQRVHHDKVWLGLLEFRRGAHVQGLLSLGLGTWGHFRDCTPSLLVAAHWRFRVLGQEWIIGGGQFGVQPTLQLHRSHPGEGDQELN